MGSYLSIIELKNARWNIKKKWQWTFWSHQRWLSVSSEELWYTKRGREKDTDYFGSGVIPFRELELWVLQLFLVPAFWGWSCCVTGPNKSSNLCTTLPPLARHTNSPVTDCLYHPFHCCNYRCFRIFSPIECVEFAPTTFRIKTNYFRNRDFFSFPKNPDGLLVPTGSLFSGYRDRFSRWLSAHSE